MGNTGLSWPKIVWNTRGSGLPGSALPPDHCVSVTDVVSAQGLKYLKVHEQETCSVSPTDHGSPGGNRAAR
jgi:hypothetical protein